MKDESEKILKKIGERSRYEFEIVKQVTQGYIEKKNYSDSLYLLEGMLKGAPDNPDLRHLKGFILFSLNKKSEALPEFRQVTSESRFFQDAVIYIAFILQAQGKAEEAIEKLRGIIEMNPENPELKYYLATVYEEAGRYYEAENHFKQVLEKDPNNTRFLFRLGVVYDKQNKKDASIAAMRRVIALDPRNTNALNYLGYTFADLGQNLDEAEQLILEAIKYKPFDGFITDSLGWVYYKKGEYEKALQHLKKAQELSNEDPVIMEHIGDTYLKLNDEANAFKYFQASKMKRNNKKSIDSAK